MKHQPILLVILDGWGCRKAPQGNAIAQANPDFYSQLLEKYPCIPLQASGNAVGLPEGQMGNSEVGHLNMGAGRIVYQELTRIDKAIEDKSFFQNPVLVDGMVHAKKHNSTLHLMGLVSNGGVHSSLDHLMALIKMAKEQGVADLRVHAFLDGRDVPPKSAAIYLQQIEKLLLDLEYPQIATICGRYYAMDRDQRWERVEKAYNNLVLGDGRRSLYSEDALTLAYREGETDEFVTPRVCDFTYEGMKDGDSIIFFNFRPDRAREITRAFIDTNFTGFERKKVLSNLSYVCMTMYDETFDAPIAYPKQPLTRILAEVLSEQGIRQFRTAETEKYAHVTYFFNGGYEEPYPGEDRKMIPSPKVATYDLQPEMSLSGVTDEVVKALQSGQYQFIATNFANPDMVGHTGVMNAAVLAVEAVDKGLEQVITEALKQNWVVLLTADHGNIETMTDDQGNVVTSHTTEPVPFFLISNQPDWSLEESGSYALCNVSPTILDILGIEKPAEMTAESMLIRQPSRVTTS